MGAYRADAPQEGNHEMNDVSDTPASSQPTPDPVPPAEADRPAGDPTATGPSGEEEQLEEVKKRTHPFG